MYDAVVVGGGHNGLVAATMLARAGRSVVVLERRDELGGAAVSASPWPGVGAHVSRYSYLVSLFPGELMTMLGLPVRLIRRPDPPYTGAEWNRFREMIVRVAGRVAPTLLEPLRSREELRGVVGDDHAWAALVDEPLSGALERSFSSDEVRGVIFTDAVIGTFAPADDPQLRQNRCFLYHVIGDGTGLWKVPEGGMGALTGALAAAALSAGAELSTGSEVVKVESDDGGARVECADGSVRHTRHVLAGVAPCARARLLGEEPRGPSPEGSQLKVNMVVSRLPRLRDSSLTPEEAFARTFHVNEGYEQLQIAYAAAAAGRIPAVPPCEFYCHSLSDPSILSPELRAAGAHTLTAFGLHMPYRLFADDPAAAKAAALASTLASIDSVLAEPIEDCLLRAADGTPCIEAHTPPELEAELGMPRGHIFHRDLAWPFAERDEEIGRWGVETDRPNVWLCGAGARRGGGVSGIPGHNAARAVLEVLE